MAPAVDPIRLLVLSDLHAYDGAPGDDAPSALSVGGDGGVANRLFGGVVDALKLYGVEKVDAVLCAGDMTNHAEKGALVRVWSYLHELSRSLDAPLIATAGNHDYSSRGDANSTIDPKDSLQDLEPLFPTGIEDEQKDYFAYNYAAHSLPRLQVVTLNSCAYHGYLHEGNAEYVHGRVSKKTVKKIVTKIDPAHASAVKVVLTHHHPIQLPYFDTDERSQILDAGVLLQQLEDAGSWLIIHGHKHRPWLQYAQGGGGSPIVFSAGSFSAEIGGGDFGASIRNQFYLVEIDDPVETIVHDLELAGRIRAWSRSPYGPAAWNKAGPSDGMPWLSGFGWRISPSRLASRLAEWLASQADTVPYSELLQWEPRIQYASDHDLQQTFKLLTDQGEYKAERDAFGEYTGVSVLRSNPPGRPS